MFGYSVLRAGRSQPYFKALMDELAAFGVPLEGLHTETGPGVFEAAIRYSEGLEAADRAEEIARDLEYEIVSSAPDGEQLADDYEELGGGRCAVM